MKLLSSLGIVALLFGFLTFGFFDSSKVSLQRPTEIGKRVVKIQVIYKNGEFEAASQGTGTKIGNGYILTNAHLFLSADQVEKAIKKDQKQGKLKTEEYLELQLSDPNPTIPQLPIPAMIIYKSKNDQRFYDAVMVSSDTKKDVAILKMSVVDDTLPVIVTPEWSMGETIYLEGNPANGDFVEGKTRLVGFSYLRNPMGYWRYMYMYPCDTGQPGFSGSGIYNKEGDFMGIFELGTIFNTYCFAIPARDLLQDGVFNLGKNGGK